MTIIINSVSFDLSYGYYTFYWVYEYMVAFKDAERSSEMPMPMPNQSIEDIYSPENSKTMMFDLKFLKIFGIDNTSYECEKCKEGFSMPGSGRCSKCPDYHYFDNLQGKVKIFICSLLQ